MDDVENSNRPTDKLLVYTALFGNYDKLREPSLNYKNCDFICFTDQRNLKSRSWKIIFIENPEFPPNIMNRKYKILTHRFFPHYCKSVYIDSNIAILSDPFILFNDTKKNNLLISAPPHLLRGCVYEEANAVISKWPAFQFLIEKQLDFYERERMPKLNGLNEMNVIYRIHNHPDIIKAMELWFEIFLNYAPRDQLSFSYVAWKCGLKIYPTDFSTRRINPYFIAMPHNNDNIKSKIKIYTKYFCSRLKMVAGRYWKN